MDKILTKPGKNSNTYGRTTLTDSEKKCIMCKKPGADTVAQSADGTIQRWHIACRKSYLQWLNK